MLQCGLKELAVYSALTTSWHNENPAVTQVMKNYKMYVGIDISKLKLDLSFISDPTQKEHDHVIVANGPKGLAQLLKLVKKKTAETCGGPHLL